METLVQLINFARKQMLKLNFGCFKNIYFKAYTREFLKAILFYKILSNIFILSNIILSKGNYKKCCYTVVFAGSK